MAKPLTFSPGIIPPSARPAIATFAIMLLMVCSIILFAGGNPMELARIGTIYSQKDPNGTEGYDGQFVYYVAREPNPQIVRSSLDVPAYRYQRILMPLAANILAMGQSAIIPWLLPTIVLLSQFFGTWTVGELLYRWGVSLWYAPTYGMWVGITISIRLDLPEPLAYALVAAAFLAQERKRYLIDFILFGFALLTKVVAEFRQSRCCIRWCYGKPIRDYPIYRFVADRLIQFNMRISSGSLTLFSSV
jgi:hypothetical protein